MAVKAEAEVTTEKAVSALRNMKREGSKVEPQNKEHQAAYITLRDTNPRVKGGELLNYLASQTTNVSVGAETALEYWGRQSEILEAWQTCPQKCMRKKPLSGPTKCQARL